MNPTHLLEHIIRPSISAIGLWSREAEVLLLATAAMESDCGQYVVQNNGPALGIFQMEPETHRDIYENYLDYKPSLKKALKLTTIPNWPKLTQLKVNPVYATAMARMHYRRVPEALPEVHRRYMWNYYKFYYNTPLGKSDPIRWNEVWDKYVMEIL